jgi:hypothetical protein
MKEELVDAVLAQVEIDLFNGDYTVLEELLKHVPNDMLTAYLPEEVANKITKGETK